MPKSLTSGVSPAKGGKVCADSRTSWRAGERAAQRFASWGLGKDEEMDHPEELARRLLWRAEQKRRELGVETITLSPWEWAWLGSMNLQDVAVALEYGDEVDWLEKVRTDPPGHERDLACDMLSVTPSEHGWFVAGGEIRRA